MSGLVSSDYTQHSTGQKYFLPVQWSLHFFSMQQTYQNYQILKTEVKIDVKIETFMQDTNAKQGPSL